ncbi:P-loop containing nucleoside triphosphate hydrolase,DNA mismatch repair protein MutS, core,DNA [Cinara cedri]|uniref:P-loop containing nucleoside triphosphate hydrolase,DNA mismatch repair protein MutS, core,DNA n=1 Tax=Cinara cedri TaxID=506608 RepID=A0A5E4M4I0_9HEMI|nr:P-loop containing nucleoside triphosphate hydrolase,DNA mismatch repair protein MutS, core,DNA [Cinara cedri]
MNVVKSTVVSHRKATANDFKIRRPGQYIVPLRINENQLFKKPNTNKPLQNLVNDNIIIRSQSKCRDDLNTSTSKLKETNNSPETRNILQFVPSTSKQSNQSESFNSRILTENPSIFLSDHEINEKVEGFIFSIDTPRQDIESQLTVNLPRASPVVPDIIQTKSRNSLSFKSPKINLGKEENIQNNVILVLTGGRRSAQGEIGLAAIDLKIPILIMCQINDIQTYTHTINKINIINPGEILIPNTFMNQMQGIVLYNIIKNQFPLSSILTASRKHFCENEEQVWSKYYAISAAAALLKHLEFNHNVIFHSNTLKVKYEGIENSMFIDMNSASRLELVMNISSSMNNKNTLYNALNHCITIGGQRRLRSSILQPSTDIQLIHNRQEAIEELISISEQNFTLLKNVINKFIDTEQLYSLCTKISINSQQNISKLQVNYALLLKTTLEALPALEDILKLFNSTYITDIRKSLSNSGYLKMFEIIDMTMHKESTRSKGFAQSQFQRCFGVKSNLNPVLDVSRAVYSDLVEEFHDRVKILGEQLGTEHLIMKNSSNRGFHVQVNLKNINNFDPKHPPIICKHVICVKNIVKFTTEDLLVLNIRITQALNEIQMVTNEMLFAMFEELRKYMGCIFDLCNSIADLDLIVSFAQFSMRSGYTKPKFGQHMDIKNSRHPILEFINLIKPVENDIFATTNKNLNIITGPNMGGKSIYIRQVALLQIIAQIGCFVPASEAQFRICDKLFTRIGFGDNIESNSSTWVLEIKELNAILPSITTHSLIIIDELCRGTSCDEGSSLAWAICEHIMQSCAFIFLATHSILVTKLQDLYCNVVNYHMEALPAMDSTSGLSYTYKLLPGVTNINDYGLALAGDVKLPEKLIEHAIEIGKTLHQTKMTLVDNPSNETFLILDNCIQSLLYMKDNECLNTSTILTITTKMMEELIENRRKNNDPLMELIDSDDDIDRTNLRDNNYYSLRLTNE